MEPTYCFKVIDIQRRGLPGWLISLATFLTLAFFTLLLGEWVIFFWLLLGSAIVTANIFRKILIILKMVNYLLITVYNQQQYPRPTLREIPLYGIVTVRVSEPAKESEGTDNQEQGKVSDSN